MRNIINIGLKLLYSTLMITTFSGCSLFNTYAFPKITEPHAEILIAKDDEHIAGLGIFRQKAIVINKINNKNIGMNAYDIIRVKPGKITLKINENNIKLSWIFRGELSFIADAGKKYLLTSQHIGSSSFDDVVFMIVDESGKIISYD